jgi:hypothetical protein
MRDWQEVWECICLLFIAMLVLQRIYQETIKSTATYAVPVGFLSLRKVKITRISQSSSNTSILCEFDKLKAVYDGIKVTASEAQSVKVSNRNNRLGGYFRNYIQSRWHRVSINFTNITSKPATFPRVRIRTKLSVFLVRQRTKGVPGGSFPGVKRQGRKAGYSPSSRTEVKNGGVVPHCPISLRGVMLK